MDKLLENLKKSGSLVEYPVQAVTVGLPIVDPLGLWPFPKPGDQLILTPMSEDTTTDE